jgi:hypothetical protein
LHDAVKRGDLGTLKGLLEENRDLAIRGARPTLVE